MATTRSNSRLKSYSLLLGANRSGTAKRKFSVADDVRIREITRQHFPSGFTILSAKGGWYDPGRGKFTEEESRQILVTARSPQQLRLWCAELARALKQKELLVAEIGRAFQFSFR